MLLTATFLSFFYLFICLLLFILTGGDFPHCFSEREREEEGERETATEAHQLVALPGPPSGDGEHTATGNRARDLHITTRFLKKILTPEAISNH